MAAYQLGHGDAKLVRDVYGHGQADALERMKRGARAQVYPFHATRVLQAAAEAL